MTRDGRCDWCQRPVVNEPIVVLDGLLFHMLNCLQHYRNYCKFIRELGHKEMN